MRGVLDRVMTRLVSHALMSPLKPATADLHPREPHETEPDGGLQVAEAAAPQNKPSKLVTSPVPHVLMSPYVAAAVVEFATHASTAVSSSDRFANV